MEVSIPMQRPRPQNLSVAFGGSFSDPKSYTASFKPLHSDWITNCRGITSATLKNAKTVFDRATLEREFREQINFMKKQNEKRNGQIENVLEVDSDHTSSENLNKNSSSRNSRKASPLTGSPSARRAESQDSHKRDFEAEMLNDKVKLVEKEQEIERLQNEIRSLVENKNAEISSLLKEKDEIVRKSEELAEEVDHVRAKYSQLSLEACEKDARISTLEAEVRGLIAEQQESHKLFQQMHEAKVLINEFSGKNDQEDMLTALQLLIEECKQTQESFKENINNLQGEMNNKNLHIEVLLNDVNQMKEFIVEHHGLDVFEGEEKEMEAKNDTKDETEITDATEATDRFDDQSILVIPEDKEELEERSQSQKVTVIIEQPIYRNNSYRGYHGSHYESHYDSNYYRGSYDRRTYRNSRPWRDDPMVVYQPKSSVQAEEERYIAKEAKPEVKETKFEPFKDRKTREEDPVYKQLESMIKELNEKLVANEKKAKKFCEEKLLEASKAHLAREENLLAEMEKMKDEKKGLLKKIDDMQWEKAYEYTQKAKIEKQQEEEAANKQKVASLEASKKKKKNK